eukprot:02614.XXX_50432_50012_1 [CDS] Oithona nana genome sequencing.
MPLLTFFDICLLLRKMTCFSLGLRPHRFHHNIEIENTFF